MRQGWKRPDYRVRQVEVKRQMGVTWEISNKLAAKGACVIIIIYDFIEFYNFYDFMIFFIFI